MCEMNDKTVTLASLYMLISQEMYVFPHLGFRFQSVVGEQLVDLQAQSVKETSKTD